MILGLGFALVCALGTNLSSLLKARGAVLARPIEVRHPLPIAVLRRRRHSAPVSLVLRPRAGCAEAPGRLRRAQDCGIPVGPSAVLPACRRLGDEPVRGACFRAARSIQPFAPRPSTEEPPELRRARRIPPPRPEVCISARTGRTHPRGRDVVCRRAAAQDDRARQRAYSRLAVRGGQATRYLV